MNSVKNNVDKAETIVEDEELNHLYYSLFEKYSYNNPIYAKVSYHVLLGQILRNVRIPKGATYIDSRISLFLLQGSGSGKSTAYNLIYSLGDAIGLKVMTLDEVSDAALIGTIESEHAFGEVSYGTTTGILSEADIIHYDEASNLINTKEYSKSALSYLQTALNPIGSPTNVIFKKLAHGPAIEVKPWCSLLLTSFFPPGMSKAVVRTGLFQRIFTTPRLLTRDDRKANSMQDIELVGEDMDTREEEKLITKNLIEIQKFVEEEKTISFTPIVKPILRNKVSQFYKAIDAPNQQISRLLDSFVPRYQDHMYRLSIHSAAMNYRTEVSPKDISYAFNIVFPIFKLLLSWLESDAELSKTDSNEKRYLKTMFSIYKKSIKIKGDKWLSSTHFVTELIPRMGVSRTTVFRYIKIFTEQGWIKCKKEGRSTYYMMTKDLGSKAVKKIKRSKKTNV
jgi:predicted transcriptional regulator